MKQKFVDKGIPKLILIADGIHEKKITTEYFVVGKSSSIEVDMLRLGGFAAV